MADEQIIQQLAIDLRPDPARTVVRPFWPGGTDEAGLARLRRIVARTAEFDDAALEAQLKRTWQSVDRRQEGIRAALLDRADELEAKIGGIAGLPEERRLLLGAYFSAEYSFEAAALFNPSIVPHPDQSGAEAGATRFVLSLRGIGEGHLSSVTFRTGSWAADGSVVIDTPGPTGIPPVMGATVEWHGTQAVELIGGSDDPSETVLFPVLASQSRGIEDLRLTPFPRDENAGSFVGTYTAVSGEGARQEMLHTDDFMSFRMHPVAGDLANSKGMALFPRRVGGRYLALGRQDNENLWLATSDDLTAWSVTGKLAGPAQPWESIQIGNCGSPIEIDEGWLVLTHGVGVMRNYCMGAMLLDRDDPSRIIGRLTSPLIEPGDDDRDGYVPNVIYTCGALVRGRSMLLPYAVADEFTRFATVSLDGLVARLLADVSPG